ACGRLRVSRARRAVRGVHAAVVGHSDRADVSARRDHRRESARHGRQHPDADRPRRADRARGEERDPDRRVRTAVRGARRHGALRCRDRGGANAASPDPDDVVRVHSRRAAARDRGRAGQGDAPGARHRRVLRDARRDAVRADLHAGLLRRVPQARHRPTRGTSMMRKDASRAARFPRASAIAACWSAVFAAACAVGPDYRPPELPSEAARPFAGADPDYFVDGEAPGEGWQLYDDEALVAAIGEALDANTDLRAAAANLARAAAVLREARGGRLPSTTLGASSTSGEQRFVQLQQSLSFEDTVYDVGFDVAYQVDLFG